MRKTLAALLVAALVFAAAAFPAAAQDKPKPLRALLVLGGCCHDYVKQADILAKGIAERANIEVVVALDDIRKDNQGKERLNPVYNNPDFAKGFDVIIHDECSASVKDDESINKVLKPHQD